MIGSLDSRVPDGPIEDKWTNHKFDMKLVAPHNKRRFDVIVVGSGLAGAAASASVAAAEPPARPVPTTMTVSLRRLAGLTSLAENL